MRNYYIYFTSVFILFSCKNKEDKHEDIIVAQLPQPIEVIGNTDSLIYQIDSTTVSIQGDTLKIEKPFIYTFNGFIDNKKIQIHVSNLLSTEYGGYNITASIYIDGEKDIFSGWFDMNNKTKILTAEVTDYDNLSETENKICTLKLYDVLKANMYIECVYKNKSYKIYPSKEFPSYKCYDVIDYTLYNTENAFNKEEAMRPFTPNRVYSFFADIMSKDKYYAKLQTQVKYLFSDSLDIEGHKTWKHQFHVEQPTSDVDYYSNETLSNVTPIFIDSTIYVASDFSYSYMGGAHGVFSTYFNNYEIATGKLINLDDVLNMTEKFSTFYDNEVRSMYKEGILSEEISIADKFYLLPTGIVFSYAPYELLGFAAGEPHIFFTYTELKPFIKENSIILKYLK
jgi:hypothetical protein